MELILHADRQFNHGNDLSPCYRDWMNPAFPDMSNAYRKRVLETLVRERTATIRRKADVFEEGRRYSVLRLVRESERYLRIKREMVAAEKG